MKIIIDEEACKVKKLTPQEVFMILLIRSGTNIPDLIKNMTEKQMLVKESTISGDSFYVTQRWSDLCDEALFLKDDEALHRNQITKLAQDLMAIFPEGKKQGTSQYWRGNIRDVTLKLQKFFKLYGNKYTDNQILTATQNYVNSFNGNYQFMRVLKYFISKHEHKTDSEGNTYIEEVSDLAAYIENAGQEESLRNDWITTLK